MKYLLHTQYRGGVRDIYDSSVLKVQSVSLNLTAVAHNLSLHIFDLFSQSIWGEILKAYLIMSLTAKSPLTALISIPLTLPPAQGPSNTDHFLFLQETMSVPA